MDIYCPTQRAFYRNTRIFSSLLNQIAWLRTYWSSRPEVFYKKRFSYKFRKIHRKITVLEPLFNKVKDLRSETSLKKRLQHRCYPANFTKLLITAFL